MFSETYEHAASPAGDAVRWADVRAEARKITDSTYVDYTWMNVAEITYRQRLTPRVGSAVTVRVSCICGYPLASS